MNVKPVRISEIERVAKFKPAGYLEELLNSGRKDNVWVYIPEDRYAELKEKYAAHQPPSLAPSQSLQSGSNKIRGLGDVVYRAANPIARAIDRIAGTHIQGCGGCQKRREALNKAVPFNN